MRKKIDQLFTNLDQWRHFPAYQLERRADIFFSLYLPEILRLKFGRKPQMLIPEFPIHIPTVNPGARFNLSYKVDYLAVLSRPKEVVLVELKTDPRSRNDKQDQYLTRAQTAGIAKLLLGVKRICEQTASPDKYEGLISALVSARLITVRRNGDFKPMSRLPKPHIIYIQPNPDPGDPRIIEFRKIAELVAAHGDYLRARFARSLREWSPAEAGNTDIPK